MRLCCELMSDRLDVFDSRSNRTLRQPLHRLSLSLTAGLLFASASLTACGISSASQRAHGENASGQGGNGESPGETNAGTGNTLDLGGVGSEPMPTTSGPKCSSDLRRILDENGATLATCPDEEGCAGGHCVRACDAATQSQGSIGC